jgi:rhodanese-related sulfurtransferase
MKSNRPLAIAALLAAIFAAPTISPSVSLAADSTAVQPKAGWYHKLVQADFVAKYAILPKPEGVQIIDSRPATRKFDPGHIPTAMNLPDSQFDKLVDQLPKDKSTLLIFYCDGPECMLSHNSAFRAEKLGYTNIQVYAEGYPDWIKNGHICAVSVPFIKKLMDEKAPMTLIDSRPKERKFDKGHIPGAISIPDLQFDKMVDRLPTDKAAPLYFYCEGLSCKLSSDSAAKAVKLGYSAVKVVPEGYPAWEKLYGATDSTATPAKPVLQAGKESGTITVASFEKIFKEAPDTIHVVDVRDPAEMASGSFKGAIAFPINTLEKRIEELPSDKPIVFVCGTGARSGEAHDMAKLYRPALKTYFLEADIKWNKDGSYSIVEKK